MLIRRFLVCVCLVAVTASQPAAQSTQAICAPDTVGHNPVACWASLVQPAIQSGRPPASSEVLHTLVALAVYDAVMAVEGGYEPYTGAVGTHPDADLNAAVATAAYTALTNKVTLADAPRQALDSAYQAYMTLAGQAASDAALVNAGTAVGLQAAQAVLAARQDDGFGAPASYTCSSVPPPPGEFEPNGGCGAPVVDAMLAGMRPYTLGTVARYIPDGPQLSTEDFVETRDYGRDVNSLRSPEQTDVVYFWNENTYVQWNRHLIRLALDLGMAAGETARMFAMVHTASADAIIVGFTTKYQFRFWRPRTAIPALDDPAWKPLLSVNHPEYPSAHAFWSTALTDMLAHVLGTQRFTWTIDSTAPQLTAETNTRAYKDLNAITREIDDARVWAGLHWRHSTRHGAKIGREVARHVSRNFFQPIP
jgi:hypothetical protein